MTIKMTILLIGCVMIAGGLLLHFVQSGSTTSREDSLNDKVKKLMEIQKHQALAAQENMERSKIELKPKADEAFEAMKDLALPAALADLTSSPPISPTQSRVGGPVYLPEGIAYPSDESGQPLLFLVQINFAEMPPLPNFPKSGILQFFARADEELGSFGKNKDQNWRAFHWPETVELSQRHEPISMPMIELASALIYKHAYPDPTKSQAFNIHEKGRRLQFRPSIEDHLPSLIRNHFEIKKIDSKFSKLDEFQYSLIGELLDDIIYDANEKAPIRIGGYPSIPQNPPKFSEKTNLSYEKILKRDKMHARTLLNIDSVGQIQIWDNDSINFLILKENLELQNFENIGYYVAQ